MKRLLLITLFALLAMTLSAQKKSNYEKYVQAKEDSIAKSQTTSSTEVAKKQTTEYDDLYYQPGKGASRLKKHKKSDVDVIVDTLVKQNPEIKVTYEYNYDPFFYSYNIGRFYHGGFNYWMYGNPWYYSNWMYDPYDFYWDMRFSGYPYWNYPYYNNFYFGYNYWNPWRFNNWNYGWHNNYNHNNWYSHNNGGNFQQRPEYGRRERPSNLSNTYNNGERRIAPQQNRIAPQNRSTYGESRRSYSPSYNNPRMSTRPQYNNSRTTDMNRSSNTSNMGNTSNMSNRRTQISTERRTYQPTQNYTTPSRSYSPPANRSSEPQGFGRTFNFNSSGGERRSSSSSNFSSGGNSNSSAGSSSGNRSSGGGSSSSGRR